MITIPNCIATVVLAFLVYLFVILGWKAVNSIVRQVSCFLFLFHLTKKTRTGKFGFLFFCFFVLDFCMRRRSLYSFLFLSYHLFHVLPSLLSVSGLACLLLLAWFWVKIVLGSWHRFLFSLKDWTAGYGANTREEKHISGFFCFFFVWKDASHSYYG
ncbi:hypothetical protein QBC35DRAFT_158532 [Podospora australis]|uniref:Uncharacterized protein n=1 Tax=Podospora australis TaxID=1536484 RepID=A0AAN6X411_9PEZI|nr:hypothetical protein QBC35DRAFT_158532 [Podospora australis]